MAAIMHMLCLLLYLASARSARLDQLRSVRIKQGTVGNSDLVLHLSMIKQNGCEPPTTWQDTVRRDCNAYFLGNPGNIGTMTVPGYGRWHMLIDALDPASIEQPLYQYTFSIQAAKVWCGAIERSTEEECKAFFDKPPDRDCKGDYNGVLKQRQYDVYHIPPCACAAFNVQSAMLHYSKNVVIVPERTDLHEAALKPVVEEFVFESFACKDISLFYPDCRDTPPETTIEVHEAKPAGSHYTSDRWQMNHWNIFLVTMYAKMIDSILMRNGLTTQPHIPLPLSLNKEVFLMEKAHGEETNPLTAEMTDKDNWVHPSDMYHTASKLYTALGVDVDKDTEVSDEQARMTVYHNIMISQTEEGKYNWMRIDFEPLSFQIHPALFLSIADDRIPATSVTHDLRGRLRKVTNQEIDFARHLVFARFQMNDTERTYRDLVEIYSPMGVSCPEKGTIQETLRQLSLKLRDDYGMVRGGRQPPKRAKTGNVQ